ncbi:MAG: Molecular chaperone GrpE (heat shock protein) [Bryobacterales bacterium]|jgi:molecular chaperone GrpE|nr:Molecular chaperone GrpE (heat shock protein) [Bryobacterales bacterium]
MTGTEETELERLRKELQNEHEMHLRALADFDNYRRRVDRDRASAAQFGKRDILLSLIELLDGFDRAMEHVDTASAVTEGFQALQRQLLNLLETQGVTPFNSVGESFDPALHEAIGSEERGERRPGTITAELRRGYRWGDQLLRPAGVRVAQ